MTTTDSSEDDEEIEIHPRAPREVCERLVILVAIVRRAFLETGDAALASEDPAAERFDLTAWLQEEGLNPLATPEEMKFLHSRLGHLTLDAIATASWQSEAAVALGWALGLVEPMPDYDSPADPSQLLEVVPSPWQTTKTLRQSARLRTEQQLAGERERAELWHWRAEIAELLELAASRDRAELLTAIREVAEEASNVGVIKRVVNGDFPVHGRPYRALDSDGAADLGALAAERLRALNWVCGFGASWDTVPLDL